MRNPNAIVRNMRTSLLTWTLTAALLAHSLHAHAAAARPSSQHLYDGAWTIEVKTSSGPCLSSRQLKMRVERSKALPLRDNVAVEGDLLRDGSVRATVARGSATAHIRGVLRANGTGGGSWRSSGAPIIGCSGTWHALRT